MQLNDLTRVLKKYKLNSFRHCTEQEIINLFKEKGIPIEVEDQKQFNKLIHNVNQKLKSLSNTCKSHPIIQNEINKLIDKFNLFALSNQSSLQNFQHLKTIRNNSKEVKISDLESKEVKIYPSIYKASKEMGVSPRLITYYDGKILKEKYDIQVNRI